MTTNELTDRLRATLGDIGDTATPAPEFDHLATERTAIQNRQPSPTLIVAALLACALVVALIALRDGESSQQVTADMTDGAGVSDVGPANGGDPLELAAVDSWPQGFVEEPLGFVELAPALEQQPAVFSVPHAGEYAIGFALASEWALVLGVELTCETDSGDSCRESGRPVFVGQRDGDSTIRRFHVGPDGAVLLARPIDGRTSARVPIVTFEVENPRALPMRLTSAASDITFVDGRIGGAEAVESSHVVSFVLDGAIGNADASLVVCVGEHDVGQSIESCEPLSAGHLTTSSVRVEFSVDLPRIRVAGRAVTVFVTKDGELASSTVRIGAPPVIVEPLSDAVARATTYGLEPGTTIHFASCPESHPVDSADCRANRVSAVAGPDSVAEANVPYSTGDVVVLLDGQRFLASSSDLPPREQAGSDQDLPPVEVVVSPASVAAPGLHRFSVQGTGWDTNEPIFATACPTAALSTDNQLELALCDLTVLTPISVDESGAFSIESDFAVAPDGLVIAVGDPLGRQANWQRILVDEPS